MADAIKQKEASIHSDVQDYYGKTLSSSGDLKTNACCTKSNKTGLTYKLKTALSNIHPEVSKRYYGCGLVFPEAIEGSHVLDLGCGAGRDCFVLSQLVGQDGSVTGVDMTKEQIDVARQYVGYHADKFGHSSPNVSFIEGFIEELLKNGIQKDTMDVIISNCVINLCPNKRRVLEDAFAILKIGGEMYFSDIYTDRPLSNEVRTNKILVGECIGGALEWRELMSLAADIGFAPPVLVDVSPITFNIDSSELSKLLGENRFCSATYRLFKIPKNIREDICTNTSKDDVTGNCITEEIYYNGTITDHSNTFKFSYEISFDVGVKLILPTSVTQLINCSRFANHFTFNQSVVTTGAISPYAELCTYNDINPFKCMEGTMECGTAVKSTCCC